ncbi:hypothetical protein CYLTODRAFT_425252 [Cylindrobasidium torrendii FP15055 ss-10]|uniref:Uncharacterized protein n=1 Tax=Cylindrobasidium torrendii FP15055 ss-10 TaxID=1314674 RepID=A0A0D7B2I7_9AGAR|nr:hypothetical protein CYLTODRAFT_425252 [Cylindrobasidium torrendii FP15055 ss-10]
MHAFAFDVIGLFKDMTAEEYNQLKFEGLDPKTEQCFKEAMGGNYRDGPMPLKVDTGKRDRDGNKIMEEVFITFDPNAPPVGPRKYLPTEPLKGPYAPADPSHPEATAGRPRDLEFYLADENSKDSVDTSGEFEPEKDGQPAAQTTGTKMMFSKFELLDDAVEKHAEAAARGFEDPVATPDSPTTVGHPSSTRSPSASNSSSHHPIPPPEAPSPFDGLSKRRRVISPPSSHLDDDDDDDSPFRTTRPRRAGPSNSRAPPPKKPRHKSPSPPPRRPAPVASRSRAVASPKPRRPPKNTYGKAGKRAAASPAQHSAPSAEPLGVAGPGPSTTSRQVGTRHTVERNESPGLTTTSSAPRRPVRTPTVQPTASSTVRNFARPTAASLARAAVSTEVERRPPSRSRSSTSQQPPRPRRGPGGAPKK